VLVFALLAVIVMVQGTLPLDMSPLSAPVDAPQVGDLAQTCKFAHNNPFLSQQCGQAEEALKAAQMERTQMEHAQKQAQKQKDEADQALANYKNCANQIQTTNDQLQQEKKQAEDAADKALEDRKKADASAEEWQNLKHKVKDILNNNPKDKAELQKKHDEALAQMKKDQDAAILAHGNFVLQQKEYVAKAEEKNRLTDELKLLAGKLQKEYQEFKDAEAEYNKQKKEAADKIAEFNQEKKEAEAAKTAAEGHHAKFVGDYAALEEQIKAQEKILMQLRELLGAAASFRSAQDRFNKAKSDLGVVTPPAAFWSSPFGLFFTAVIAGVAVHFLNSGKSSVIPSGVAVEAPAAAGKNTPRRR